MTLYELLQQVDFEELWRALGGGKLVGRSNPKRGAAFWRGSKDLNIVVDLRTKQWFDHAQDDGGGVVSLIERVYDCRASTAAHWLAEFHGVHLDQRKQPLSASHARRLHSAAVRVLAWLDQHCEEARIEYLEWYSLMAGARDLILRYSLDHPQASNWVDVFYHAERMMIDWRYEWDRLRKMPYSAVIEEYRRHAA